MKVEPTARRRITCLILGFALLPATVPSQAFGEDRPQWPAAPHRARVRYEGSFQRLEDGQKSRSVWQRLFRVLAGPADSYNMVRPFGITTDAEGRIAVVDTEQRMLHVLDYARGRYLHLAGSNQERFASPIGVVTDHAGNFYITDSVLGKVFVFRPKGKFKGFLGDVDGEGYFKRPTGLAYDPDRRRLYLTDTLYHKIYTLDLEGNVIRSFGERGSEPGQFNYPLAVAYRNDRLYVVDAMNFRIQILDVNGRHLRSFGTAGDGSGTFSKPKSISLDSEGHIYVVDSHFEVVQVFDEEGRFLLAFGGTGSGPGRFQLPTGIFIDPADRIYVADSYNSRVQVFQYLTAAEEGEEKR